MTKINVLDSGGSEVVIFDGEGVLLGTGDSAVCLYFVTIGNKFTIDVLYTGYSDRGCPTMGILDGSDTDKIMEIEFSDFPGWKVHAVSPRSDCVNVALIKL